MIWKWTFMNRVEINEKSIWGHYSPLWPEAITNCRVLLLQKIYDMWKTSLITNKYCYINKGNLLHLFHRKGYFWTEVVTCSLLWPLATTICADRMPQQIMCSLLLHEIFSWPKRYTRYSLLALLARKILKTPKSFVVALVVCLCKYQLPSN